MQKINLSYTEKCGRDSKGLRVQEFETKAAYLEYFKAQGIDTEAGRYGFSVTNLRGYSDVNLKYRVYFRNRKGTPGFLQSDEAGNLDESKLIEKAREYFDECTRRQKAERASARSTGQLQKEVNTRNASLKAAGSRFEIRLDHWNSPELFIKARNLEELDALIKDITN